VSILLTVLLLIVVLGTVFAFARLYVRRSTRGTATQAANLFSSYPDDTPAPDEANFASPRILGSAGGTQDTTIKT
jgi:hypothetical protein